MKRYLILCALVVAMMAPFGAKRFFIDDYYHFLMAKGILENPLRPYDFLSDDDGHDNPGWDVGGLPRMVNPPMTHYLMASMIKLVGTGERALHTGFMIFPLASALCLFFVAGRLTPHRWPAVLVFVFSPVFWVTSTGLMLDSVKLAFYLAALAALVAAVERDDWRLAALSGLFMGAALLSKYTAASVLPVSLAYLVIFDGKWKKKLWIFAIPSAMMAAWAYWNIVTYGSSHLFSAMKRTGAGSWNLKVMVNLVFLSGGTVFAVGVVAPLASRLKYRALALAAIFAVFYAVFSSTAGGFSAAQSALLALWISVSAAFFWAIVLASRDFGGREIFAAVWFLAVFLTMIPAMAWTAGRYFMALAAPASILFAQLVDKLSPDGKFRRAALASTVAVTFALGAFLAASDYAQAAVYEKIRDDLRADGVRPSYFKSDIFSGITGYLKEDGWRIVVPGEDALEPGDLFLIGYIQTPVAWIKQPEIRGSLRLIKTYEYRTWLPFRLVSVPDAAGFYATCWGALPWSVSSLPLERYKLYVVEKN